MAHPNAALTPRHRLQVARLVVDDGDPISEVAARVISDNGPVAARLQSPPAPFRVWGSFTGVPVN